MASSHTRQDKEQFFRDLAALDHFDSGSDEPKSPQPKQRRPLSLVSPNRSKQPDKRNTTAENKIAPLVSPVSRSSHAPPAVLSEKALCNQRLITQGRAPTMATSNKKRERTSKRRKVEVIPEDKQIFKGMTFYFVPNDDNCQLRQLRIGKAEACGAKCARDWSSDVDHVIVDVGCDLNALRRRVAAENLQQAKFLIVNTNWLTESIEVQELRDEKARRFRVKEPPPEPKPSIPTSASIQPEQTGAGVGQEPSYRMGYNLGSRKPRPPVEPHKITTEADAVFQSIVDEMKEIAQLPLDVEPDDSLFHAIEAPPKPGSRVVAVVPSSRSSTNNTGFVCMQKNDESKVNPNSHTIDILQQMSSYYDRVNDQWRSVAYRKAASALNKQTIWVNTKAEAMKIPMIGNRLAEKIEEIATTSRLKRLDAVTADPDDHAMKLFMGIYEVGYAQARRWISQGCRTLEDISAKADLAVNQRIGLKHYDDFQTRIPRTEVEQHASIVDSSLKKADPGLEMIIGGSYRRGSVDSGDIDIIITKKDAQLSHIRDLVHNLVLPDLQARGFLKAILTDDKDGGSKMHGASALSESSTWRRIDLLYVPWDELGAALIYFTGNDIFNRSLRLLASRKNMRLNQHGLFADVMRGQQRKRITTGHKVAGGDEKQIFEILGVPYWKPEHRQC